MTEFLTAIARRALGEATELRPAVSPVIPPVARDVPGARRPARLDREPDVAVSRPAVPSAGEDRGDDQGSERTQPLPSQRSPRSPVRGRRLRPAQGRSPATRGPEGTVEVERTSVDPGPGQPETSHELVTEAGAADDRGSPIRNPLPPAPAPHDAPPTLVLPDAPRSLSAHHRPEPTVVSPFTPTTVVAADRFQNASAVPTQWPDDNDDGPTTVHVSIGRIEVRAPTPPAQTPAAPRPTQPRLSLDDYLRRRDGGRGS